ncbi:hypothetical protein [Sphingomonas glacialis]|uniref:Transmembrane anchor protein n=1 Tax=Sphingomonas glacialis TaxID=658225 RepID=A0A502FCV1_9SPHN|nr:hypothetical protein [Sphingomonas glacialis]TPG47129.1 hypothetical protein EAH76_22225 [Sphingomonas glacialis]
MTPTALPYRADGATLARASAAALIAGAAILTLFVLPAEFGIDPTGVGKAIGLTALSGGGDADDAPEAAPPVAATATAFKVPEQTRDSIIRATPFRSDERTLTLAPHSGAEIKAEMRTGDSYNFTWKSTGPIKMDMHGEASLTASDFTTYWKQKGLTAAQGTFTAPFNGIHGWYWRNQTDSPVTITLHTSGFYAKLIQPPVE